MKRSPKLILHKLNIHKTDNILIKNDNIYISKKEMTRQRKTGQQNLIVKDKKTYLEYKDIENSNSASWNISTLSSISNNKSKAQIETYSTDVQNSISSFQSKPLQQINGNKKLMNTIILSSGNSPETLNESEVTFFGLPEEFLRKSYRDNYLPNIRQQKAKQAQKVDSVSIKSVKRLKSNFKCVFPLRSIHSENYSKRNQKYLEPFQNQCDVKKATNNEPAVTKINGSNSSSKCSFSDEITHQLTKPMNRCTVVLDRIDAKICFMDYLGLKLTVKTNATIMHELSLLRKYNIRKCKVLISKAGITARKKL